MFAESRLLSLVWNMENPIVLRKILHIWFNLIVPDFMHYLE